MTEENILMLHRRVFGPSGSDRLSLYYIPCQDVKGASDFHSLVWERDELGEWRGYLTITQQQFQGDDIRRRWVNDLHSIDPQSGRAVIMVAEGDQPEGGLFVRVHYNYSWRVWDLLGNGEIEKLKECQTPFDRLD